MNTDLVLLEERNYLGDYLMWGVIFLVGVIALLVVFHYARRYFNYVNILEEEVDENGKVIEKTHSYHHKGRELAAEELKLKKKNPSLSILSITSDSEIKEGTLESFIVPDGDVHVKLGSKAEKKEEEELPYKISLPEDVQIPDQDEVKPVLLLSSKDVINHVNDSNKDAKNFPLLNYYKYIKEEDDEILLLYAGQAVYAIVIISEASAKTVFRLDSEEVRNHLSDFVSLTFLKGDVYSVLLDSRFRSVKDYLEFLDSCYRYVINLDYQNEEDHYIYDEKKGEASNSLILSYNENLSRNFDPAYDRAQMEAEAYRNHLYELAKKEAELDVPLSTMRDKVYYDLSKLDDSRYMNLREDKMVIPNTYYDDLYVEPVIKKEHIMDIHEELKDLVPVKNSRLDFHVFIRYIMDHKDMVSLTINLSKDLSKVPVTMDFLTTSFAIIYMNKGTLFLNLKMDEHLSKNVSKDHPHILHVKNGEETDWYRLTLDDTFTTYQELYKIFLLSYNYVKDKTYAFYSGKGSAERAEH